MHEETLDVPSVGGRPPRLLSRQILSEIIEPRVEELFSMMQQRLKKTGFEDMFASGIVLPAVSRSWTACRRRQSGFSVFRFVAARLATSAD